MTVKMSAEEIQAELPNFYGTSAWYRFNPFLKFALLTDGSKFVAESCGAYWLMEEIGFAQKRPKVRRQPFQVWKLAVTDREKMPMARLTCEDGNYNKVYTKRIDYTDFPLNEISLWAEWSGDGFVIYLPSEH